MKTFLREWQKRLTVISLSFLLSACASIMVPRVAPEEEKQAKAALLAEAEAWQREQEQLIRKVGARLRKAAGNEIPIAFNFLAKPEQSGGRLHPDAVYAGTDGQVVWVTRGMMRFLKNEDELAIVLAHEMAHVYRGHASSQAAKQVLRLALGPAAGIGMLLVNAATNDYDKDKEREADLYGLIWAHKAGYRVDVAKDLLKRMAIQIPESVQQGFLSRHPTSAERLLAMEKVAEALKNGQDPLKVFASKEGQEVVEKGNLN